MLRQQLKLVLGSNGFPKAPSHAAPTSKSPCRLHRGLKLYPSRRSGKATARDLERNLDRSGGNLGRERFSRHKPSHKYVPAIRHLYLPCQHYFPPRALSARNVSGTSRLSEAPMSRMQPRRTHKCQHVDSVAQLHVATARSKSMISG
jgi:hypothetical protein